MIRVQWNTGPTLALLRRLQSRFHPAMRRAVENVFTLMMIKIILRTPKPGEPPEPASQEYIRTGRLVNGWAPAARRYGIPIAAPTSAQKDDIPGQESAYQDVDTASEIRLTALNAVRYGQSAEGGVPGKVPRHAMVGKTLLEMSDQDVFATEVREAWRRL